MKILKQIKKDGFTFITLTEELRTNLNDRGLTKTQMAKHAKNNGNKAINYHLFEGKYYELRPMKICDRRSYGRSIYFVGETGEVEKKESGSFYYSNDKKAGYFLNSEQVYLNYCSLDVDLWIHLKAEILAIDIKKQLTAFEQNRERKLQILSRPSLQVIKRMIDKTEACK